MSDSSHCYIYIPELAELIGWQAEHQQLSLEFKAIQEKNASILNRLKPCVDAPDFISTIPSVLTQHTAALSAIGDDLTTATTESTNSSGYAWLRADPVILQADLTRVHLLSIQDLHLTNAQANAIIDSLQTLFDAFNFTNERCDNLWDIKKCTRHND